MVRQALGFLKSLIITPARAAVTTTAAALLIATPFVAGWEGVKTTPYADKLAGGLMTVCAGETRVEMRKYTEAECMDMLEGALAENLKIVHANVTVPTSPEIDAALISFIHNVGAGAFQRSTLLKKLNAGDYVGGCQALATKDYSSGVCRGYGCGYAGGVMVRGLQNRRIAERDLCLKGIPNAS